MSARRSMADWKKAIAEERNKKAEQIQQKKKRTETSTEKKISRDDL